MGIEHNWQTKIIDSFNKILRFYNHPHSNNRNKTSVGSVKLGKALDLGTRLSPGYFGNLLPTGR